jgi:hypothetical protein
MQQIGMSRKKKAKSVYEISTEGKVIHYFISGNNIFRYI